MFKYCFGVDSASFTIDSWVIYIPFNYFLLLIVAYASMLDPRQLFVIEFRNMWRGVLIVLSAPHRQRWCHSWSSNFSISWIIQLDGRLFWWVKSSMRRQLWPNVHSNERMSDGAPSDNGQIHVVKWLLGKGSGTIMSIGGNSIEMGPVAENEVYG